MEVICLFCTVQLITCYVLWCGMTLSVYVSWNCMALVDWYVFCRRCWLTWVECRQRCKTSLVLSVVCLRPAETKTMKKSVSLLAHLLHCSCVVGLLLWRTTFSGTRNISQKEFYGWEWEFSSLTCKCDIISCDQAWPGMQHGQVSKQQVDCCVGF